MSRLSRPVGLATSYDLLVPIARGGMATVFVARKHGAAGFTRLVAIKRAHESLAADPNARASIVEEARIASQMHHPNVVAVHDVEELEGELLLVMDYVEGVTVAELVTAANKAPRADGVAPEVALRIALDACAGLHAAHTACDELGRVLAPVHRDVSPQNILVGRDGGTRVTDFGIAKSLVPERFMTSKNVLKGKVAYMAPEYIIGGRADPPADVFAMGVVAWEMLANARLFRADTDAAAMLRVRTEPAPRVSSMRVGLPDELDAVLEQALAKRPEDRFASAAAFAAALESVARDHDLIATTTKVAITVERLVGVQLDARREEIRRALREADGPALNEDEISTLIMQPPLPAGFMAADETTTRPVGEGFTEPLASPPEVTGEIPPVMAVKTPLDVRHAPTQMHRVARHHAAAAARRRAHLALLAAGIALLLIVLFIALQGKPEP